MLLKTPQMRKFHSVTEFKAARRFSIQLVPFFAVSRLFGSLSGLSWSWSRGPGAARIARTPVQNPDLAIAYCSTAYSSSHLPALCDIFTVCLAIAASPEPFLSLALPGGFY